MLNSLRNRLFASYIAVLFIALTVLSFVLLTFLQTRAVPHEYTWNRLELLLSGFSSQQLVRDILSAGVREFDYVSVLDGFAQENNVRVLLVANRQNEKLVLYDSAGDYSNLETLNLNANEPRPRPNAIGLMPPTILTGSFVDKNNVEWLFTGFSRQTDRGRIARFDGLMLMLAEEPSSASLEAAFGDFNEIFLQPLMNSACIGGILAFAFAIFISRSIVRPLQALSNSAQQVAKGEFHGQVPETGPSEIRQVASAFNLMMNEVETTQEVQREFLANVSHDLKTPLTSIQGYSQAIMDGAAKNPADAALVIHDEAERLTRMVTELTDLARLQAGRLSMKMTALDLGQITAAISQRLSIVAAKKNIQVHSQTSPMPLIAGDGDRLVQVFTNVIGNAIKYTPNGGEIWVNTGIRNGGVEVIVRDNGIGIPPEDLPRLFERFYQVDKSRGPQRGTGLGLAITREIVQAHGGKIDISSAGKNQGTTVKVWLPSPQLSTIISRR